MTQASGRYFRGLVVEGRTMVRFNGTGRTVRRDAVGNQTGGFSNNGQGFWGRRHFYSYYSPPENLPACPADAFSLRLGAFSFMQVDFFPGSVPCLFAQLRKV